jgi:steroid delta-isomerase-like uncharacterized protein
MTNVLIERLVQAMAANDAAAVAALYTEDCVIADPVMEITGRAGLLEALEVFLGAFHLTSIKVDQVIADGNRMAVRWSWSVIHQGDYLGVPATGKAFDTWNIMLLEVRDGLFSRDTSVWDAGELRRLEQLADMRLVRTDQPADA